MSQTTNPPDDTDRPDFEEMSNRELLEFLAEFDPETVPLAKDARRALDHLDREESS